MKTGCSLAHLLIFKRCTAFILQIHCIMHTHYLDEIYLALGKTKQKAGEIWSILFGHARLLTRCLACRMWQSQIWSRIWRLTCSKIYSSTRVGRIRLIKSRHAFYRQAEPNGQGLGTHQNKCFDPILLLYTSVSLFYATRSSIEHAIKLKKH